MADDYLKDDNILESLKEREKELNCLYKVDEVLSNHRLSPAETFDSIVRIMPSGWRFPELCRAKLIFNEVSYQTPGFVSSPISELCDIRVGNKTVGNLEVVYIQVVPLSKEGYFLEKESKLIRTIAERIGQAAVYRQMRSVMDTWEMSRSRSEFSSGQSEWEVIVNFLLITDHKVLLRISRKLINHLLLNGVNEASDILNESKSFSRLQGDYVNYPSAKESLEDVPLICGKAFGLARKHISGEEITILVKDWIQEERAYSLIKAINSVPPSLRNIIEEIKRFRKNTSNDPLAYSAQERWISVSLINLILSGGPDFVNVAKQFISHRDFFEIVDRMIIPLQSQGTLGGKGSGLFLAQKILEKESVNEPILRSIRIPKTWYIVTDAITEFLQYNNLEELNEQKYKEIQEARIEYPGIMQLIKNSVLPPEIIKSLSTVLDDIGETPIIVRSSSKLEDHSGSTFSGKYKSLFLSNRGSKQERLEALQDAVLEVYASVFSPDPIQYRIERGLLDIHEEMGILIQEVVGNVVGKYFFPLFAGVAFSNNEYRWSPRIKREDGLIRMTAGLGTRAVDRLSDDFTILVSPGQPGIRVNTVPEEIKRYAPRKIDLINLETGQLETADIRAILRECGEQIPEVEKMVSLYERDNLMQKSRFDINFERDDTVVTFEGIISSTETVRLIGTILRVLGEKTGMPVDIEFASDGKDLYLLQSRPQSFSEEHAPASIPRDVAEKDILFSAKKYIGNGRIDNISHVVYVDPDGYNQIENIDDLRTIGKVIGKLNRTLPRRQFALVGPGRWGSRGDIRLGVNVTYSDISNTAILIEVARNRTGYLPELSFGTHFFQDLVEAEISYLPLYPDDDNIFNESFFSGSENKLGELLPEYVRFSDIIRVINIPETTFGRVMSILMNAELEEAVGILSEEVAERRTPQRKPHFDEQIRDEGAWRWRLHMAERMAAALDPHRFGVKAVYLIGSTKNGTAGPGSDIDLLIHFEGTTEQKADLRLWLDGWSLSLSEMNYLKSGYHIDGILDVHFVTDEDIGSKDSFAIRIESPTDPAYRLKLMGE
jgi:hypothetical protein